MDDRRAAAPRGRVVRDDGDGSGYPLREEATEGFAPAPLDRVDEEMYVAPVAPVARRRRFVPATPWPAVLTVLLLLAGLGVAYAATRPNATGPAGAPAAASPGPSSPGQTPQTPPAPRQTPPAPPTTTAHANPPPVTPARAVTVAVPSTVGTSLDRALAELSQAKLTADVVHVDSSAPSGRVVAQQPAAGSKVAENARVRLSVAVAQLVRVPGVVGRQGLEAVHELQGDHLVASLRYVPSTQPARRVVSQYPAAGAKVRRGTSVLLNLSQGLRKR